MILDTNNPFELVGAVVTVGTATTGAAFLGGQWLVKKWLEQKFAAQLAELHTEQERALKHIQSSIDHQIHRAKKLYDTEFEVLTKAWNMLEEMYGHVIETTHSAPIYTEWDGVPPDQIREILDVQTDFTAEEKEQVVSAEDPSDEFRVVYDARRVVIYEAAGVAFGHYLGSNAIFMRPEIREKFKRLSLLVTLVISEFASNIRRKSRATSHFMTLNNEGRILRRELQQLIEGRLWSATETKEAKA